MLSDKPYPSAVQDGAKHSAAHSNTTAHWFSLKWTKWLPYLAVTYVFTWWQPHSYMHTCITTAFLQHEQQGCKSPDCRLTGRNRFSQQESGELLPSSATSHSCSSVRVRGTFSACNFQITLAKANTKALIILLLHEARKAGLWGTLPGWALSRWAAPAAGRQPGKGHSWAAARNSL